MSTQTEPRFGRMIPAMVTAYDDNKQVDLDRVRNLARYLLDGGSDSLLVCGTTGESPTVDNDDKLRLFETVVDEVDGRVPVIGNVGSNNTERSVEFGLKAKETGISGIMAVVPYYNKPPQEGMYQHFKAIAEGVGLPTIVYNIPGRCGVNMEAETTLRLARDVEHIAAVKEASGDIEQIKQIIDNAPDDFIIYSGDDSMTLPVMQAGGHGVIATAGNVIPKEMKELTVLCAAGDFEGAQAVHEKLLPIMKHLFTTSNPILVKQALNLVGVPVGGVRLPLVDATEEQSEALAEVLKEVGALS